MEFFKYNLKLTCCAIEIDIYMCTKRVAHCAENQQFGFCNKTKFNAQPEIKFRQILLDLQENI